MQVREKTFQLLCEIMLEKKYSNLVLRKELNEFQEIDRHLITRIVYGTMQNYLFVRDQWSDFMKTSLPEKIFVLMDMSIYQFLFMDKLPSYAIVNDAVEIAKKLYHGKYQRVVNALLRRYLREEKKALPENPLERLSIETSHPLWLVKMWNKQYGEELTKKICLDNQKVPLNACRVNTLITTREKIMEENPLFVLGNVSKEALILKEGNIANTVEFLSGKVTIQDEASQCVALMLDPQPYEKVLDICAAPGTKTTHIAQLMQDQGEIVACDLHEHRVKLIENAISRLHLTSIHPRVMDALECEQHLSASFDRILVDAPCSGYGVLKRKNDIKVHANPTDMDRIIPLQKEILEKASHLLKEKGILVYSTCTLNKKENEKQVESFLSKHPEFVCLEMKTMFPFEYDTDGFFMAKLQKVSEQNVLDINE